MGRKWTKEIIISKIRNLKNSGSKLNSNYVQQHYTALYSASCIYFGSWGKAIEATGFDYATLKVKRRPPNSLTSKRKIATEISKRHQRGLSLNGKKISKEDSGLYTAAVKRFGINGWRKALKFAGFDPDAVHQRKDWDKKKVQQTIYLLLKANSPLNTTFLCKNRMCGLYNAGVKIFGSWKSAIESCGLDYEKIRRRKKKWTHQLIVDEIKILKQKGIRLNAGNINDLRMDLYDAGRLYFGSWHKAVEAAGFSYRQESIKWTYKNWLEELTPEQLETIDKQTKEFALRRRETTYERNRTPKETS